MYLSTTATGNGSAVIMPVYSSLVEVGQVMAMNLPNATARSNTFTLTLNYVADRVETYGAPFDSATFEVSSSFHGPCLSSARLKGRAARARRDGSFPKLEVITLRLLRECGRRPAARGAVKKQPARLT